MKFEVSCTQTKAGAILCQVFWFLCNIEWPGVRVDSHAVSELNSLFVTLFFTPDSWNWKGIEEATRTPQQWEDQGWRKRRMLVKGSETVRDFGGQPD